MSALDIAVIGAGIVGTAVALHLQMEGHRVTVYDPRAPGTACSFGNSGGIGIGLVAPIAMPGIGRAVPRLLLDPDQPLFISAAAPIRKAQWFWRFWRASRRAEVERIAAQRAALNRAVLPTLEPLLERATARELIVHKGMVFVFAAKTPPPGALERFALGERHGVAVRRLDADEMRAMNPGLAPAVGSAVFIPGNRHCIDPGGLVTRFADAFRREGGTIVPQAVRSVQPGQRPAVIAEGVERRFDRVVLAAGVWSRELARSLGSRVLLEAERGYHVMLPHSGLHLSTPTTLSDRNIVMTPMAGGLRITGIAEFAEPDSPARFDRALRLLRQARDYFPALDGSALSTWMGPRPSTPDSLPIIGRAPHAPNVIFAFGHGQSGLAHASVTARLVTEIVGGRTPFLDVSAFSPARFGPVL